MDFDGRRQVIRRFLHSVAVFVDISKECVQNISAAYVAMWAHGHLLSLFKCTGSSFCKFRGAIPYLAVGKVHSCI